MPELAALIELPLTVTAIVKVAPDCVVRTRSLLDVWGIHLANLRLVTSIQVIFNMFEQRPATEGLFDSCSNNNVAAIARVPLDSGALSGTWTLDTPSS